MLANRIKTLAVADTITVSMYVESDTTTWKYQPIKFQKMGKK